MRERDTLTAVLLAWVVIVVLFFTFSTRQARALRAAGRAGARDGRRAVAAGAAARAGPEAARVRARLRADGVCRAGRGLSRLSTRRGRRAGRQVDSASSPCCRSPSSRSAGRVALAAVPPARRLARLCGRARIGAGADRIHGLSAHRRGSLRSRVHRRASSRQAPGSPSWRWSAQRSSTCCELGRPTYNFGHARWREWQAEAADAAAWLAERPGRAVLMNQALDGAVLQGGHGGGHSGRANQQHWYLVTGKPDPACAASRRSRPVPACTRHLLQL